MKLRTHYVFSTGLLTLLGTFLTHDFSTSLFFSGVVAVLGNMIIDKIGHEVKHGYIRRTPLTHTFPRSMLWGSIPALGLSILYYYMFGYLSHGLILLDLVSPLNGLSHMVLDVFTEKGVYVKKNGNWVRFALAHYPYNDPTTNGLAIVMGILMFFLAVKLGAGDYYPYYP